MTTAQSDAACDDCTVPAPQPSGRLGLVLHPRSDPTAVVETLTRWARSHGKRVIVEARDAARVPADVEPVTAAELVEQADALISLGGDGTMLGARCDSSHNGPSPCSV